MTVVKGGELDKPRVPGPSSPPPSACGKGKAAASAKDGSGPVPTVIERQAGPAVSLPESRTPLQIWAFTRSTKERLSLILKELGSVPFRDFPQEGSKVFEAFLKIISELVYDPENREGEALARCLASSGIFWENKVVSQLTDGNPPIEPAADLKGILLSLMRELGEKKPASKEWESVMGKLRELLDMVERDQHLNLSTIREGIGWYWFLAGKEEKGFKRAEVFGRRTGEDEAYRICMNLEFTSIGQMEVDLYYGPSGLNIQVLLQNEQMLQPLRDQIENLRSVLLGAGFNVMELTCATKSDCGSAPPFFLRGNSSEAIHFIV